MGREKDGVSGRFLLCFFGFCLWVCSVLSLVLFLQARCEWKVMVLQFFVSRRETLLDVLSGAVMSCSVSGITEKQDRVLCNCEGFGEIEQQQLKLRDYAGEICRDVCMNKKNEECFHGI